MANRIGNFTKTVTTAGTRVVLSTTVGKVNAAIIQALSSNTGVIHVGDATVLVASGLGVRLGIPGTGLTPSSVVFSSSRNGSNEVDLSDINIDSSVNGEGVSVTYTKA